MAIKRKTRMYEPWGYQEENNYQGSETIFDNDLESFFADVKYIDGDKKIHFYNKDGEEKATLDVTKFAPSVVESAVYDKTTKILTITFSNGDKVEINLADLIDENEFADGLMVDNGIVKVMIDSTGEPYLSVSQNGIKISGVDQAIETAVEAEKTRAEAAEQALQTALEQEITDRIADVDAEEARAKAAEEALDAKIEQEITDRKADVDEEEARAKAAEANLSRRLDTLNDELDAEKTIREAADVALGRRIDQEIDDRKADVDEEEARAKAAEQALQEAIDAEEARATSAETALQTAIEAEGQRAQDAEAALQEAIDAETARATSAETDLQAAIEAEGQRAQDAEAALDEKINNVESALTDAIEAEKTRAEGVEADLAAAIEGLGGNKFDDVDYDSSAKTINFYAEGSVVKSLDATPFIKDGMIERVYIDTDTQELVIVWNEASGKTEETRIPLSDIFNPDNYYTKDEIDDKVDEINSAITAVEGDITTIQGDIVDINSAITEIQGDITTIEGDITNINSSITEINSSITEINEAIDDMKDQYGDDISALTDSVRELEETVENDEFTISMALNDLNTRKLDASAYTPTDLSNYYTKDETSGKTEIADALDEKANLSDIPSVTPYADSVKYNSTTHFVEFYHGTTAGTKVFEYDASPFLIDGMVESVEVVTVDNVKYLRITWNSAAGGQVTDIPLGDLFDPTLYYTKDEIDAAEYTISQALIDLDERKLDASAYTPTDLSNYYTKDEVDARDLWVSGTGTGSAVLKGSGSDASGSGSVADGQDTVASGRRSHAEGYGSMATGDGSHAEGNRTTASGTFAHAEGENTVASQQSSHAEGDSSSATSANAHAEGFHTLASGGYSHAEGYGTVARGNFTHVEGKSTSATTSFAHAEGENTWARGPHSHAEGYNVECQGDSAHAEGIGTITNNQSEHASGQYNVSTLSDETGFGSSIKTLFSVGNGTSASARHNAFEIKQNGDIYININGNNVLLQNYITELERITAQALIDLDSRLRALEG